MYYASSATIATLGIRASPVSELTIGRRRGMFACPPRHFANRILDVAHLARRFPQGRSTYMATALAPNVGTYLGGDTIVGPIATDYDLVDAVLAGFPVSVLDTLIARGLLAPDEVDRLVLPRRTLSHRRARGERLSLDESDRLARVARVLAVAEVSFGNPEKAARWLRRPSRGLRGEVPLALLVTTGGARLVEDELTRIASGDLA